eukprot:1070682-Pleurochrysis_carterae.AAC.3
MHWGYSDRGLLGGILEVSRTKEGKVRRNRTKDCEVERGRSDTCAQYEAAKQWRQIYKLVQSIQPRPPLNAVSKHSASTAARSSRCVTRCDAKWESSRKASIGGRLGLRAHYLGSRGCSVTAARARQSVHEPHGAQVENE